MQHGRLARVVIPTMSPSAAIGRRRTFLEDRDYALYRNLLAANCRDAGVEVWAWCLMPNRRI